MKIMSFQISKIFIEIWKFWIGCWEKSKKNFIILLSKNETIMKFETKENSFLFKKGLVDLLGNCFLFIKNI